MAPNIPPRNTDLCYLLYLFLMLFTAILFVLFIPDNRAHAQPVTTVQGVSDCDAVREIFNRNASLSPSSADERQLTNHLIDHLCEQRDLAIADECEIDDYSTWSTTQSIMARDLAIIMADPVILDSLSINTLEIRCVKIVGSLDLSAQNISDRFIFNSVVFQDPIILNHSRFQFPVEFVSSMFQGKLEARYMEVDGNLLLKDSVFKDTVELSGADVSGNVSANTTTFESRFIFANTKVSGGLFVSDDTIFQKDFTLLNAVIAGDFSGLRSTFCGDINAYGLHVGGDFILGKSGKEPEPTPTEVTKLVLRNATVERNLKMGFLYLGRRAPSKENEIAPEQERFRAVSLFQNCGERTSADDHLFQGMRVGGDVDLSQGKFMGQMNFMSAKIGGSFFAELAMFSEDLWLEGVEIAGSFRVNSARFDRNLVLRGATISKDVELWRGKVENFSAQGAHFGSNVDVRGRLFSNSLNLNGVVITGDLIVGTSEDGTTRNASWGRNAKFLARNLEVRGIQDTQTLWEGPSAPKRLDFVGFTYSQFAGGSGSTDTPIPARNSDWFRVHWFEKQINNSESVAAGLYGQLVDALRQNGFQEQAKAVLVDFYDAVGPQEEGWMNRISHFFSGFLDYGNSPGKGLLLFLAPLIVGVLLVVIIERPRDKVEDWKFGDNLFFTVDALLPAVSLQKTYDDYVFKTSVKYYFYILKFSGYVFLFLFIRWINGVYTYFPLLRN